MIVLSWPHDLPLITLSLQFESKSSALQKVKFLSSDLSLKASEQEHANYTRVLRTTLETQNAAEVLRKCVSGSGFDGDWPDWL